MTTGRADELAMEVEAIRANLAAQQQEAAERASERLRERQAEMGAYPGGAQQWLRNKAQIGVLAEEELPKLRAEIEALRTQVERVVEDRESAADVVSAGADRCEELEATIDNLHAELEAAQEAEAIARAENEELRDIVHATAVGDEVVAGMAGMMVNDLISLSLRQGEEIQELRARLQTMTDIAKSESVSEERLRGVIRDAAGKLEEALHSSRMLAYDVVEVVRQLREVLR
jgi:DNA repair exonuclease SbcCD ATPase subunit